jgi:hypothetical protein
MKQIKKRGRLQSCLLIFVIVIVVLVLACGVLAVTTTPLSQWLYAHNYYFQGFVDKLHGK